MATNLFKEAAKYRRAHPSVSQAEAVQIVARKNKKKPARKKTAHKKVSGAKKSKADTAAMRKLRAAGYSIQSSKFSSNVYAKKNGTTYADTPQDLVRRLLTRHKVGKAHKRKKAAPKKRAAAKAAPRKIKFKIKKNLMPSLTIGAVRKMGGLNDELHKLQSDKAWLIHLQKAIHQARLDKDKSEVAALKRDVQRQRQVIKERQRTITALKRSI